MDFNLISKCSRTFFVCGEVFFCCYLYAFSPFLNEFADFAEMELRMVPGQCRQRPRGASGCFYVLPGLRTPHGTSRVQSARNRNLQKSKLLICFGAPACFSSATHTSCKASVAANGPIDPGPVPPVQNIFALGPEQKNAVSIF